MSSGFTRKRFPGASVYYSAIPLGDHHAADDRAALVASYWPGLPWPQLYQGPDILVSNALHQY